MSYQFITRQIRFFAFSSKPYCGYILASKYIVIPQITQGAALTLLIVTISYQLTSSLSLMYLTQLNLTLFRAGPSAVSKGVGGLWFQILGATSDA